ncbi:phosphopantetheine-binding protein [Paenibacillus medicaginis]|uniref:Phosphopantetheine-binding protein n=1 Tax=Paenibacillus medicaginis TaxID=1470560 RepID=A0ABV5BYN6_9BACL
MNTGITSIEFIRLMVAVEEAFGIELPDEAGPMPNFHV